MQAEPVVTSRLNARELPEPGLHPSAMALQWHTLGGWYAEVAWGGDFGKMQLSLVIHQSTSSP